MSAVHAPELTRVALLALGLAGCTSNAAARDAGPVVSCELARTVVGHAPWKLDLLLVIDTSPEMAPLGARWAEEIPDLVTVLESFERGRPDLRVGVISSDLGVPPGGLDDGCAGDGAAPQSAPRIAGCHAPREPFLRDEARPWYQCEGEPLAFCPERNHEGTLAEGIACIAALPADGCAARQPLEAAVLALGQPWAASFRRPDARLMVLIVAAGDDGSPGSVDDHVEALEALLAPLSDDGGDGVLAVIAPRAASRLGAVIAGLVPQATFTPLDAPSWADAMIGLAGLPAHPPACLPASVPAGEGVDLGLAPPCTVEASSMAIPRCEMAGPARPATDTPAPCWWLQPPASHDAAACAGTPRIEGLTRAVFRCEASCEPGST